MSQHFLLSPEAKTLSLKEVFRLNDEQAFEYFKSIRWADNDGKPVCENCGNCGKFWFISTRRKWKCVYCKHTFSVTSGTLFAHHKLPLQDYLAAIAIFANGAKGISALQLSRDLKVQYKTAFVLAHKIREAIKEEKKTKLQGDVEVDGAYFGGHIKPKNRKEDRIDRRLVENQTGKKKCVFVIKLKNPTGGSLETRTSIIKEENSAEIYPILKEHVDRSSTIHADEYPSYNGLAKIYNLKQINHKLQYSDKESGACTNQAESFFSRMRRAEIGVNHHFAGRYLDSYASEMAYREDTNRRDNGWMYKDLTSRALRKPESDVWCGYWQRYLRSKRLNTLDLVG